MAANSARRNFSGGFSAEKFPAAAEGSRYEARTKCNTEYVKTQHTALTSHFDSFWWLLMRIRTFSSSFSGSRVGNGAVIIGPMHSVSWPEVVKVIPNHVLHCSVS